MIDEEFIVNEVDNIISSFEKTYKESTLFKKNEIYRNNIVVTLQQLITDKKVTKNYENEIHKKLLLAIDEDYKTEIIQKEGEDYIKAILEKYGDILGGYLLYCNKALYNICLHEKEEYEKRLQ